MKPIRDWEAVKCSAKGSGGDFERPKRAGSPRFISTRWRADELRYLASATWDENAN